MADGGGASEIKLGLETVRQIAAAADVRTALARREAGGLGVFETRLLRDLRRDGESPRRRALPPPILRAPQSGQAG